MIAKVVVENAAYSFDIAFSYQIPPAMQEDIRPGCRVLIPFGKSNRARQGLVMSLEEGEESKLKPIRMLLDLKPLLNEEQLWMTEYLHKRVFCTYYEAMRAVIPSGLTMKVKVMCSLGEQQAMPPEPSAAQQKILEHLKEQKKPVYIGQLLMDLGLTKNAPALKELFRIGAVVFSEDVREKTADSKIVMVRLSDGYADLLQSGKIRMTQVRKKVISLLEESPSASLKEVCYYAGTTRQTLDKMEEAGIISYYGRQIFRSPYADRHQEEQTDSGVTLEPSQQKALDTLWHLWEKKEKALIQLHCFME